MVDGPSTYAGPAGPWREKAGSSARAVAGGWQQAARMVHAHLARNRLRTIYVLPSAETQDILSQFKAYLETLFSRPLPIRRVTNADATPFEDATETGVRRRSYDNYKYLRDGLIRAVEMAKHDFVKEQGHRLRDYEICVDATAGFKLFSIAAAVATFDRNVVLGYVVTGGGPNPDGGIVKLYDAHIDFLPGLTNRLTQET